MSTISDQKFATLISRILRWSLGLLFIGMAWYYENEIPLYIIGVITFATGFFTPKRCTEESCKLHHNQH